MKNIRKVVMVIIGTLIGAGFASGREIYTFFYRFGKIGILGIIISSIITGIIIYFTLKISDKKEIDNYDELLKEINNKYSKLNIFIKIIVTIFLLVSFYVMIAGFSAYIKQAYNIEIYISSTVFALIVYFILKNHSQGMLKINNLLVPIIIFLIIILGIKNMPLIFSGVNINVEAEEKYFLIYSILYASYNSIILIPVIISLRKYIENKNEIKYITILSVNIIILLALCIFSLLLKAKFNIGEIEMPILEITKEFGNVVKIIYGVIIIISIFTSAISVGYSFLENISKEKTYKRNLIIICVSSVLISNIGFSNLVEILYPIFGVFGILQIFFICKKALEKKGKECYKLCNKRYGRVK